MYIVCWLTRAAKWRTLLVSDFHPGLPETPVVWQTEADALKFADTWKTDPVVEEVKVERLDAKV